MDRQLSSRPDTSCVRVSHIPHRLNIEWKDITREKLMILVITGEKKG
jgi:hypothetical protein